MAATLGRKMQVLLLDLRAQFQSIRTEVMAAVDAVCDSQRFILGERVEHFEAQFARYCGAPFATGCASGTDALLLALRACGVGPGDSVLTSPFTFFATAGSITNVGATPVFADIDPLTFNLDPVQAARQASRTERLRAIIPVHLYGGCANMPPLLEMAEAADVPVIEDAAQAIGAECRGVRAGTMGAAGCFSFFPSKNLGAFGDAGAVTTRDAGLDAQLKSLRVHGSREKYVHDMVGYNSRIDALQAAVLTVKLAYVDDWTRARQENAALYLRLLAGIDSVTLPYTAPHQTRHVRNQFVIRCKQRDALRAFLAENGIGTEVYYPIPLHLQPCYRHLGYQAGAFPESERAAAEVLALPVHSGLGEEEIGYVADAITAFYS